MNNSIDPGESKIATMLKAADRELPVPDEAFLAALRQKAADTFETENRSRETGTRRAWILRWPIWSAAAALVVAVFMAMWTNRPSQDLVWADVAKQFETVQAASFKCKAYHNGKLIQNGVIYFQAPDKIHMEFFPVEGERLTPPMQVVAGNQRLHLNERSHLFIVEERDNSTVMNTMRSLLNVFTMPTLLPPQTTSRPAHVDEAPPSGMILVSLGPKTIGGRELHGYEVIRPDGTTTRSYRDDMQLEVWCDAENQVRFARVRTLDNQVDLDVDLNPRFPPDMFALKGPPGYTDVREGVWPTLSPEIRKIADAYYKAREQITHFRMAVIPDYSATFPRYRQVRDGEQWRVDALDLTYMIQNHPRFAIKDLSKADFESVWQGCGSPVNPVEHLVMTYKDQLAMVGFNYDTHDGGQPTRSQWLVPPVSVEISSQTTKILNDRMKVKWFKQTPSWFAPAGLANYDLRELGWPQLAGDQWVAPHGWDIGSPLPRYYRLVDRADRPGLVGIRAVGRGEATEYWMDPARDYLCVEYARYWDVKEPWNSSPTTWDAKTYYATAQTTQPGVQPGRDRRTITQFAQTPEGHWYPKVVDKKTIFLDTQGPIDPRFFDWPANAPQPLDIIAQNKQIVTYMSGSPEEKENTARQDTRTRMGNIISACKRYSHDHGGAWPDELTELVKLNYIVAGDLVTARNPGSGDRRFVYRKPDPNQWLMYQAVLYEPTQPWAPAVNEKLNLKSGIYVGDASGQLNFVETQAGLKAILAKKYPR